MLLIVLLLLLVALLWLGRSAASAVPAPVSVADTTVFASEIAAPAFVPNVTEQPVFMTDGLELPRIADSTFVISRPEARYTLLYDTAYRQGAWVAYVLIRAEVGHRGVKREVNNFTADPTARTRKWPYVVTGDYTRSGYDRGHLLPSADRDDTAEENSATFHLSNVSPQRPTLNQRIWKYLEEEVRRMALRYDTLWIVTGSELRPGLARIGKHGVGVPEHFFKAILARDTAGFRTIAFRLPNDTVISGTFWDYALSVDRLEGLTGFDFFHTLPDGIERAVEAENDPGRWKSIP
jgi:endonuclease G